MDASTQITAIPEVTRDQRVSQPADTGLQPGAEWGLASLLTGGFLMVGAITFLVLALVARDIGDRFFVRLDILIITSLLSILTVTVLVISVFSVIAGLRGIFAARARKQPVALGLLGFLLSLLALGLWICACFSGYVVLIAVKV
jgi:hypothetical protein